jgi:hypothetical protein
MTAVVVPPKRDGSYTKSLLTLDTVEMPLVLSSLFRTMPMLLAGPRNAPVPSYKPGMLWTSARETMRYEKPAGSSSRPATSVTSGP